MITRALVIELSYFSDIAIWSEHLRSGDSNIGADCPDAAFNPPVAQD